MIMRGNANNEFIFGLLVTILFNCSLIRGINLRISIKEEQPKGTLVASLSVQFQVSKIRHKNPLVELSYKLLEETSARKPSSLASSAPEAEKSWVHLNPKTGDLTLSRKIDREVECSRKPSNCEQKLQVVLLPQTAFDIAVITLKLEDINDNSPKFAHEKIVLPLSESTTLGSKVNLDKYLAKDSDIGDNAKIKYSLSDESFFGLEQYDDNSGVPHLRLIVRQKLDFMTEPMHSYTLTARDNGSPPRSTDISLLVNVLDENDHNPVFNKTLYVVNLPENQSPDHVICQVHATDADSGDLGRVTYHLVTSDATDHLNLGNLISLSPLTGEVTLRQNLDRELHDGLKIVIEARDSGLGHQQRTARTVLQIHVTDVNDNAPVINVDFIVEHGDDVAYVPENTPVHSFIALVDATDADSGWNGKTEIKLTNVIGEKRSSRGKFLLNEEGFLQTMAKFDSEQKNDFKINISACDKGTTSLCSSRLITVIILDENEFLPQFSNPFQQITLPENSQVGSHIATCKAHDGDSVKHKTYRLKKDGTLETSANGNIFYRMSSVGAKGFASDNTQAPFAFDPLTGKISLSRPLDYEQAQKWKITVVAKDGGSPRLESHCVVTVMLNDVNDNRPVFTIPAVDNSTLYVGLDKRNYKPIIVFKAIDFDQDITSGISYHLLATYLLRDGKYSRIVSPIFNLTKKEGKLFAQDLSEKQIGEYFLKIRALDNGNITLFRDVGLKVDVRAKMPENNYVISRPGNGSRGNTEEASLTILAVALGVGIGAVLLLIVAVALLIVYIKKKNVSKDPQEDPSIQANRTPSLRNYSTTSSDKQSSRHDAMLSSLTSSPTSTMGKRSVFNNNIKNSTCSKTTHDDNEPCYVCDLKSSSTSIGQHSPYHKLVENMIIDGKTSLPKPTSPSDHDSGKGSSDAKEDDEEYGERFFPSKMESSNAQQLGPKCSQSCREFGHSDTCWMPSHSFYGTQPPMTTMLQSGKGRLGSVCSSETTNTTSSSSGPQYYQINNRGKSKMGLATNTEPDLSNFSKPMKSPQRHHSDSAFKRSSYSSTKVPRSPSRAGGAATSPLRRHSDLSSPNHKIKTRPTALQLPRLPIKNDNHYFSNYSERSPTKVTFMDDNIPSPVKHSFTKVAAV